MKTSLRILATTAVLACVVLAGCAQRFVITQDLDVSLDSPGHVRVGAVTDLLPADVPDQDRPSLEDIEEFRKYLREEIENRDYIGLVFAADDACRYEIQARLLEYTQGSGFLRFLIGMGAGSAKVLAEVKLVDLTDGSTVFCGNFEGQVTSGLESGDKMLKNVARDFSHELEKQTGNAPEPSPEVGF